MLKFRKFLNIFHNFLVVFCILATASMFYVRHRMYNLTRDLAHLDRKIEKLRSDKELLTIELTYLTSTERLLSLIDGNPKVLNNKDIINVDQLKTKDELVDISLAKSKNIIQENRRIARSQNINDLIEREL